MIAAAGNRSEAAGNLDLAARDEWSGHRGPKQVLAPVYCARTQRGPDVLLHELASEILDIALVGTGRERLGADARQLIALPDVSRDADDTCARIVLFQPRHND